MATIIKAKSKNVLKPASNGNVKSMQTENINGLEIQNLRLPIQKTYKLYIGGKFPRTESARYFQLFNQQKFVANVSRSSRKDVRNAIKVARATFTSDWAKRAPFNRGHIMYRIAEMLEYRKEQFVEEMVALGQSKAEAQKEVYTAIDRLIYYAGWADKYQQVFSSVNTVSSPHFNFSTYEPTGVVCIIAPEELSLVGLVSTVIPAIVGGNTVVVVPSEKMASIAITFAEVLHTSDLTGGAVNILTGYRSELHSHLASHMDVNAIVYAEEDKNMAKTIGELSADNVKRFVQYKNIDWMSDKGQSPYYILDLQEVKTTWHPIGY